ncbi:hypothetical protein RHIZ_22125 [Rhizobium skierniewicense]|uniref:hypothetical protein n=1 Tax=Rhizobium skierniewicense TaxID=984260 RepID=UPI001FAD5C27|nr:hypothetical protein [Rhizobium skierniewicense]MCI9868660.1 hypothetical protein [Rhizobium skierniewicense]
MAYRKGFDLTEIITFSDTNRANIDRSAHKLIKFLEANAYEEFFRFSFSHSYPRNCCESVSSILTYLLEEKYRLDSVKIVKGTKLDVYEHHFWVTVGQLHYDLTAHQFAGHKPIIGTLSDKLFSDVFPDWEVEHGREFVERDDVLGSFRAGVIPF